MKFLTPPTAPSLAADPAAVSAGTFYFNTSTGWKWYDGAAWHIDVDTTTAQTITGTKTFSTVAISALSLTTALGTAYGGTGGNAVATAGGVAYGTGSAYAVTTAGTSQQSLTSNAGGAPIWATLDLTYLPGSWAKKSVVAASVGSNLTLSGLQTVDGIALNAGDRVLVKDQTTAATNGIYAAAAGAWSRPTDGGTSGNIAGAMVAVDTGTVNGGTKWTTPFKPTDTLGTTSMTWTQIVDSSTVVTLAGTQTIAGTKTFTLATIGTLTLTNPLAQSSTHASPDTDVGTGSLHHTIGVSATQAAAGNHTHTAAGIVSGLLAIAVGGTNSAVAPTAGGIAYGTGTAYAVSAAGTAQQVIASNGVGAPSWATLDLTYLPGSWALASVWAASVGVNLTLSGVQTVDGVSLVAGNRVLVKDQTTASQNGIYVVAAGAWTRPTDAATSANIAGGFTNVDLGTVNGGTKWTTPFKPTDIVNTTPMVWYQSVDSSNAVTVNTAQSITGTKTFSLATIATLTLTNPLAIASGGTNSATAPTAGGVVYGSGTARLVTAAGTATQALVSNAAGAPTWATLDLTYLPGSWAKKSVVAATTVNITLSAPQTIDGIAVVAGNRVLVKNQTTASQNGIYDVQAAAWTRSADSAISGNIAGAVTNVDQGTVNAGVVWTTNFKPTDTLGTTAMNWGFVLDSVSAQTITGVKTVSVTTGTVGLALTTPTNSATDTSSLTFLGRASIGYDNGSVFLGDMGSTKAIQFRSGALGTSADTRLTISSTSGVVLAPATGLLVQGVGSFTSNAVGTVPITIKAFAGQTANLLNIQNSVGTTLSYFDSNALAVFGNTFKASGVLTTQVSATIAAITSQTADLLQFTNSSAAVIGSVGATGNALYPVLTTGLLTGTAGVAILNPAAVTTAGTTTQNSGILTLRSKFWSGTVDTNEDATLQYVKVSTTVGDSTLNIAAGGVKIGGVPGAVDANGAQLTITGINGQFYRYFFSIYDYGGGLANAFQTSITNLFYGTLTATTDFWAGTGANVRAVGGTASSSSFRSVRDVGSASGTHVAEFGTTSAGADTVNAYVTKEGNVVSPKVTHGTGFGTAGISELGRIAATTAGSTTSNSGSLQFTTSYWNGTVDTLDAMSVSAIRRSATPGDYYLNIPKDIVVTGTGTISGALSIGGTLTQTNLNAALNAAFTGSYTTTGLFDGFPTGGASGTFVAPPSGRVRITVSGWLKCATAGQTSYLGTDVRTGATVGSGTIVSAVDGKRSIANYNNQYVGASNISILTALTPGSTYNIQHHLYASNTGTIVTNHAILVEPLPW